ncbi:MAG: N-acetylmuramoyl-L-alanine amidase [Mesorhizobium sp.]|nr:N-acetylmuramoyl-L-alanine amidase [Mesorhizobium sp.]
MLQSTPAAYAAPSAGDLYRASGFKMAGDAARTRIVLHFDREPTVKWFLLRGPHRIVIDLPESVFAIDQGDLKPRGLVTGVRYGHLEEGRSRLIISGKGPFAVEALQVLANETSPGFRLVVDMAAASAAVFDTALSIQADKTGSTSAAPKGDRLVATAGSAPRKFTIAIDPGHGGIDGGAESAAGTIEKEITLAFGLELKALLEATGTYNIIMTRDKDEFLRLDDRVRIARQAGADLFISIHADTIGVRGVHGATVYTVSDRASDAEAKALAERENLADSVAGVDDGGENRQVVDILADLARRETHAFSIRFARSLVGQLSSAIELIKNPHRQAGFKVLRAPDVPSVLVELGYLSNARDEERLIDPEWRKKAVKSISSAITGFASARLGAGG